MQEASIRAGCNGKLVRNAQKGKDLQTQHRANDDQEVKKEVWRYTFAYYNNARVTTVTEDGFLPSVYTGNVTTAKSVA
jgi:hypothetical protein